MTTDKTIFESALLPIVLGVTGHRDLQPNDVKGLEASVGKIISDLKIKYPNSPFVLLSPLAEGADRLVARVALTNNVELIVPMPLPQEEYEKDFAEVSSLEEFRAFLTKARKCFTVGNNAQNDKLVSGIQREQGYFGVGRYIVENCQILIALWDGVNVGKKGGTSDIVHLQLVGGHDNACAEGDLTQEDIDNIFNPVQTGVVYHVMARRIGTDTVTAPDSRFLGRRAVANTLPCSVNVLYPLSLSNVADDTVFARMLNCQETMNSVIIEKSNQIKENIKQSSDWLIPEKNRHLLPESLKKQIEIFSLWDALACFYQNKNHFNLITMASIIPFLALSIEIYKSYDNNIVFVVLYLALLFIAFAQYVINSRSKSLIKYIDSRALAEGLRVNLFWRIAGIKESASDYYINRQRSETEWIRYAIRNYDLLGTGYTEVDRNTAYKILLDYWIAGQSGYFKSASVRDRNKYELLSKRANMLINFAMFVINPIVIISHYTKFAGDNVDNAMMVALAVTFVAAAAIGYYSDRMMFNDNFKQYIITGSLFSKVESYLTTQCEKSLNDNVREVLFQLGKEALDESGDWIQMHRDRALEVPKL